jgi:hypothetical protein
MEDADRMEEVDRMEKAGHRSLSGRELTARFLFLQIGHQVYSSLTRTARTARSKGRRKNRAL